MGPGCADGHLSGECIPVSEILYIRIEWHIWAPMSRFTFPLNAPRHNFPNSNSFSLRNPGGMIKSISCKNSTSQFVTLPQVDGNRTVGENMCDNGGLSHAWHAYKTSKTVEPDEPGLPGVNYSRDQIFFITYGQVSIRFASGGHKFRIFQRIARKLSPVDISSSAL